MLYTKKSFTLPATEGRQDDLKRICELHGHAFADRKGKCIRCAEQIRDTPFQSETTQ